MKSNFCWVFIFSLLFALVSGCGDEMSKQQPPVGEVFIKDVDDQVWVERHFPERDKGDLVVYDVIVPESGRLSLILMDRGQCLFNTEGTVDKGTTRVGFHVRKVMGEEILNTHVSPILNSDEMDQFKQTFHEFENRCVLKMSSIRKDDGGLAAWGPDFKYYSQHKKLGNKAYMGPTMQDGVFRAKAGKAAVVSSWFWGNLTQSNITHLTLDEKGDLMGTSSEGKPVPAKSFESPVWALVLKFEPGKLR